MSDFMQPVLNLHLALQIFLFIYRNLKKPGTAGYETFVE
jgi:hypothetical protein